MITRLISSLSPGKQEETISFLNANFGYTHDGSLILANERNSNYHRYESGTKYFEFIKIMHGISLFGDRVRSLGHPEYRVFPALLAMKILIKQ